MLKGFCGLTGRRVVRHNRVLVSAGLFEFNRSVLSMSAKLSRKPSQTKHPRHRLSSRTPLTARASSTPPGSSPRRARAGSETQCPIPQPGDSVLERQDAEIESPEPSDPQLLGPTPEVRKLQKSQKAKLETATRFGAQNSNPKVLQTMKSTDTASRQL